MIEMGKHKRRGSGDAWVPRFKALCALVVVEAFGLGALLTIYISVAAMLGFGTHLSPLSKPILWAYSISYGIAMLYVNRWLIGPSERIEYYRTIFDGWDKQKRMRWKIYVVLITVSTFVVFVL
jgi:uncharacterized protein (DUF486 family)